MGYSRSTPRAAACVPLACPRSCRILPEGTPQLYHTDPSGTYSEWKANATGRNSKAVREWLEKQYAETSGEETVKLAVRALLELVEPSSKNIEIAVTTKEGTRTMTDEEVDAMVKAIEVEKEEVDKAKKEKARRQAEEALAAAAGN